MQECRARTPGCAAGRAQNRPHGWTLAVPGVLGSSPHSGSTPAQGLAWGRHGSDRSRACGLSKQHIWWHQPGRGCLLPWEAPGQVPCGSGVTGLSQGPLGGHRAPGAEVGCLVWKAHLELGQEPNSLSTQGTLQAVGPACLPGRHPVLCSAPPPPGPHCLLSLTLLALQVTWATPPAERNRGPAGTGSLPERLLKQSAPSHRGPRAPFPVGPERRGWLARTGAGPAQGGPQRSQVCGSRATGSEAAKGR